MTRPASVAGKDVRELNAPHYFTGPLVFDESAVTVASGVVAVTGPRHTITGEGGLADDVTSFSGMVDGQECWVRATSDSVTITLKHGASLQCVGGVDIALAEDDDLVKIVMIGSIAVAASAKTLALGVADASIVTRISTEESTRASADTSLTTRVSQEESARASAVTSYSTANSTSVSTLTSADTSLATRVSQEESARASADTSFSTATSTSLSTLTAADTSLTTRVSNEESARASAVTSYSTANSTSISTLTSADTSLTTRISTEESARASADTSAIATIATGIYKVVMTAGAENAEAANTYRITVQIKDAQGTNVSGAKEIVIRSLAVTADQGDLAASAVAVGTVVKAVNPATGENVMWMTTDSNGAAAFIVTNTAAEDTLVSASVHAGVEQAIKLTYT